MIICPNCKSECEENTAFCGNCGWKLDQAPPAAAEMGSEAQAEQLAAEMGNGAQVE